MTRATTDLYEAARVRQHQEPVYLLRCYHVVRYGGATEWPFSVDFATEVPAGYTRPKVLVLGRPGGNTQTVDQMKGSSSIGTFSFPMTDVDGKVLKYLADPAVPLGAVLFADELEWIQAAGAITGYVAGPSTVVIGSERIRWDYKDEATGRLHIARNGRGVDGTQVATHQSGDLLHNGEQLRAGQRVQLLAGYRDITEDQFMSFCKMELTDVKMPDPVTFVLTAADIQRTLRQLLFTAASRDAKLTLYGNPITLYLRVLLSTGEAANQAGTVQVASAGTLVQGTGTTFSGLVRGDWLAIDYNTSTEQVFQVDRVESATEVYSQTPLTATAAGRAFRKAGSAGKYDFLGASTVGYSVGKGKVRTLAGNRVWGQEVNPADARIFQTEFKSFLVVGDTVRIDPDGPNEESAVVLRIVDDREFTSSTKLTASDTMRAYWKQVVSTNKTDGLAIPAAFVDVAGLEALRASDFPNDVLSYSISTPVEAKTFIEMEFMRPFNLYPFVTQDGKLSARRYAVTTPTADRQLDESQIVGWRWEGNEARMTNVCEFSYDWDLTAAPNDYSTRQRYTATVSRDAHGPRPPFSITSKGLKTATGAQVILDDRARRVLTRFAEPPPRLQLALFYGQHVREIGDLVGVTHRDIPNKATGRRGLVRKVFEVIDVTPGFGAAGGVVVTLEQTEDLVQ